MQLHNTDHSGKSNSFRPAVSPLCSCALNAMSLIATKKGLVNNVPGQKRDTKPLDNRGSRDC
jgi:hypothetical protein